MLTAQELYQLLRDQAITRQNKLLELYESGYSVVRIAQLEGVTIGRIYQLLQKAQARRAKVAA